MALALYRRYRPDAFAGVIGQDQVTIPLSRALDEGRLTHAYLFSGPRGCGKTSSARILARCINCEKGPTSHPCGECQSCKDLATGGPGSIDVVEIDAASHNGVDDARELRERAGFAPARDRYKIFILDEAHMVTQQGFNALLKIVEEPPEHVMFIFATTEPEKVIGTIRSRTHHYPFRLVPPETMGPYLEEICGKEGISAEPGVLKLAMRAGGGSVRDTLSVLDQLMTGSVAGKISNDYAVALLGFTPDALIGAAIDAVVDRNGEELYGVVQKVIVGGFDPRRFVEDLLARVRDMLVLALAGDRAERVLGGDTVAEDLDVLHRQAVALGLANLTAMAETINTALGSMAGATSPRMRLELLAAKLLAGPDGAGLAGDVAPRGGRPESGVDQATGRSGDSGFVGSRRNISQPSAPVSSSGEPGPASTPRERESGAPRPAASSNPISSPARPPQGDTNSGTAARTDNRTADEKWDAVVATLPGDVREYVTRDKVPTVSFSENPTGKSRLSMTFDRPLSQHAFALAVSSDENFDGQKASHVVLQGVREVFGATAMIAPAKVAANGEQVESTSRMDPQRLAEVKRQIAMARAGLAAAGLTTSLKGHRNGQSKEERSAGDALGDVDDPTHRGRNQPLAAASPAVARHVENPALGEGGDRDGDAEIGKDSGIDVEGDPWLGPHAIVSARVNRAPGAEPQRKDSDGPTPKKHIAVPDLSDDDDPWARQPAAQKPVAQRSSDRSSPPPLASNSVNSLVPADSAVTDMPQHLPQDDDYQPPEVPPDEDEYSFDDESLGTSAALDFDELGKVFEIKAVEDFTADDPRNPLNIKHQKD